MIQSDLVELYSKFLELVEDVGELSQPQTEVHQEMDLKGNPIYSNIPKISINSSLGNFHVKILFSKNNKK